MLGVGWTEMLVIGVVALIVIGPKELPALMNRIGKFAGTIRRMGADFQREINKTTGLNEVKNLRTAITQPLKATTDAIRKEFNTTMTSGEVQPSGALKPADPKVESVVDEIHAAAGMTPPPAQTPKEAMHDAMKQAMQRQAAINKEAADKAAAVAAAAAPVKAAPRKAAVKAPAVKAPATKATPKKSAARKVESPAPIEAIAPAKKPAAKKPAAKKPAAKKPADKPAVARVAAKPAAKVTAKAAPKPAAAKPVAPATKRKPAAKKV